MHSPAVLIIGMSRASSGTSKTDASTCVLSQLGHLVYWLLQLGSRTNKSAQFSGAAALLDSSCRWGRRGGMRRAGARGCFTGSGCGGWSEWVLTIKEQIYVRNIVSKYWIRTPHVRMVPVWFDTRCSPPGWHAGRQAGRSPIFQRASPQTSTRFDI